MKLFVSSRLPYETIMLSILVVFLVGCVKLQTKQEISTHIEQQFAEERLIVQSNLASAKAEPEKVWAEGDIKFFSLWKAGTEKEQQGRYEAAVNLYRKAFNTPRYEMATYDVLLAIGRALFLSGKKSQARTELKAFIRNAEGELAGEVNPMWVASDDARKSIEKNISFAKWLLKRGP